MFCEWEYYNTNNVTLKDDIILLGIVPCRRVWASRGSGLYRYWDYHTLLCWLSVKSVVQVVRSHCLYMASVMFVDVS